VLLESHGLLEASLGEAHLETRCARRRLAEHFARRGDDEQAAAWR